MAGLTELMGQCRGELIGDHGECFWSQRHADLQSIMDGTDAVIYAKGLDGRYEFINHKYEEIFSLKRCEVIGRTDEEIFSHAPDLARRFMENDRQVLKLERSMQCEETAPHTDGPHQYVSVKFPLRDETGRVRGVAGISTDITQRVRAEEKIRSLQERSDEILTAVADGVVLLQETGRIEYMNPAAFRLLGLSAEQIQSERFIDVVMAVDAQGGPRHEFSLPLYQVLKHQIRVVDQEDVFWRGNGTMMPVEYSAAPISDGGAVVTFRDIRLRLERRQQRRDLKAAQAMQGLLYPQSPPRWPGFEIAGAVFPAGDVCGDYYDFIERDEHRLALIVADASGHDLTAALMMVNARANLRSFLKTHHDLETVLHCVNEILSEELQMGKFVTTFLAELDSRDRSMTFLGAGQSALLVPCQGCDVSLKSGGLMLGIQNDLQLSRPETRTLRSGDVVIVSTDGFSETMSPTGRLLGTQRIIEFVQQTRHLPAQQILNGIVNLARDHAAKEWPRDDATLVVVKTL